MSTVFNVERFKSALTNGGVRPNQFAVQLSFPTYVAELLLLFKSLRS